MRRSRDKTNLKPQTIFNSFFDFCCCCLIKVVGLVRKKHRGFVLKCLCVYKSYEVNHEVYSQKLRQHFPSRCDNNSQAVWKKLPVNKRHSVISAPDWLGIETTLKAISETQKRVFYRRSELMFFLSIWFSCSYTVKNGHKVYIKITL